MGDHDERDRNNPESSFTKQITHHECERWYTILRAHPFKGNESTNTTSLEVDLFFTHAGAYWPLTPTISHPIGDLSTVPWRNAKEEGEGSYN